MVNSVPARTPLGASTNNRKWFVDVEDPEALGVWLGLHGIGEFKFKPAEGTVQEDSDFDSEGFKSSTVTALTWGGDGKLHRKTTSSDPTAYDPAQEVLRRAARGMGPDNRVQVRVYEMQPNGPRVEAYQGYVMVTWSPDGGSMEATDTVSFGLQGQGKCNEITHPEGVTAKPVIASVLPSGAAAGATVAIEGAHFTGVNGAAGVKFGATNAATYQVLSDSTILAVLPAGAAGSAPVVVGTSDPEPYTRA